MNIYRKIMNAIHQLLNHTVTALLGILIIIVSLQIATRIFPFLPYLLWTEEIARFLLTWLIFIGAAIGVKESTHFVVNLLPDLKSKALAVAWDLFVMLSMMLPAGIFAYRGYSYAMVLLYDTSDIAQISMLWVAAAIPLFGILSVLFLIEQIITVIFREET